jgi:aryl sulfotransferase
MTGYVWLASYPKSGNTWMRLALACIRSGKPVDFSTSQDFGLAIAGRHRFDLTLGIESSDLSSSEIERLRPRFHEALAETSGEPLFAKVHDCWRLTAAGEPLFPPATTIGTIYMVRDPRDVAISFADHLGIGIDEAIEAMGDSETTLARQDKVLLGQLPQRLGTWSEHVERWLAATGGNAPHLVRYEDMRADPVGELRRVVDYLGWEVTDEAITRAVDETRFERLRGAEEEQGFLERSPSSHRFFRKGQAGAWRAELAPRQAERIEATHGVAMRRLNYL